MDTSIVTSLLTSGGVLFAALLTYLGVRLTQRQIAKKDERSDALEKDRADAQAYVRARETWDELLDDLRTQLKDQRGEIIELRSTVASYHADIVALRDRVDGLAAVAADARRALDRVLAYARELVRLLRLHNITPPLPPEGLELD